MGRHSCRSLGNESCLCGTPIPLLGLPSLCLCLQTCEAVRTNITNSFAPDIADIKIACVSLQKLLQTNNLSPSLPQNKRPKRPTKPDLAARRPRATPPRGPPLMPCGLATATVIVAWRYLLDSSSNTEPGHWLGMLADRRRRARRVRDYEYRGDGLRGSIYDCRRDTARAVPSAAIARELRMPSRRDGDGDVPVAGAARAAAAAAAAPQHDSLSRRVRHDVQRLEDAQQQQQQQRRLQRRQQLLTGAGVPSGAEPAGRGARLRLCQRRHPGAGAPRRQHELRRPQQRPRRD